MMNQHLNLIVDQFPPLKRKPLLRWFMESTHGRKLYHRAILSCLDELTRTHTLEQLDRRTKIAFSLIYEFGNRLSRPAVCSTLVEAVEYRLARKPFYRT